MVGTGDVNTGSNELNAELQDALVHFIYELVEDNNNWQSSIGILDEYIEHLHANQGAKHLPSEIEAVLPHVERANYLLTEMDKLRLHHEHNAKVLNQIPMGIVLISRDTTIISKNRQAEELLDHIQADHNNGRLRFHDIKQQQKLQKTIRDMQINQKPGVPLTMGKLQLWLSSYGNPKNHHLALFLGHSTARRKVSIQSLTGLHGLTKQEAYLTRELCNGKSSLDEAAQIMGITVGTARTHLKHVFAKTGTSKQAELVKMMLTNPALTVSDTKADSSRENRNCLLEKLPSGRTISYAESGCPDGQPVLMCHPIMGSRLIAPDNQSILRKLNIRLIVPDRPGFGFTTPATTRHLMDQWLEDMHYFIPQINASGCSLLGYSSGGAYAMALAAGSPQLISNLCLVSSIVPVHEKSNLKAMLPLTRVIVHLARTNQKIAGSFLNLALNKAIRNPNSYLDHILETIPEHDQKLLQRDGLNYMLVGAFEEGIRQGIDAINNEILFVAREWQIEPSSIRCPVTIWHGTDDAHAPLCNMEQFSADIPDLTGRHWVDQAGHYMMFDQWHNILNGITSGSHD